MFNHSLQQTTSSQRMSVRDLATIGIFSVLMTVIAIVIAILSSPVIYLSLFFSSPIITFITAPLYMFMILKVHKRGTVFLYFCILAVIYLISGTPYLALWFLIGGILGEASMSGSGAYASISRITISWVICTLFRSTNGMVDIWFFTKQYLASGVSRAHFEQVARFYDSVPWVLFILIIASIAAVAGGVVSGRLMRKHFSTNGLAQ